MSACGLRKRKTRDDSKTWFENLLLLELRPGFRLPAIRALHAMFVQILHVHAVTLHAPEILIHISHVEL